MLNKYDEIFRVLATGKKGMALNEFDCMEILSPQDNDIDMTAVDNSDIVQRAKSIRDGERRDSIQAGQEFPALVRMTREGRTRTLLILNLSGTTLTFRD